jgi:hypothetical protein
MKYLKEFDKEKSYYFLIPSNDIEYIKIAINKSNIKRKLKKIIIKHLSKVLYRYKFNFLYIAIHPQSDASSKIYGNWGYYPTDEQENPTFYKNLEYIGKITVKQWEIDAQSKYNL